MHFLFQFNECSLHLPSFLIWGFPAHFHYELGDPHVAREEYEGRIQPHLKPLGSLCVQVGAVQGPLHLPLLAGFKDRVLTFF